jgi:subtilisin family serine protease
MANISDNPSLPSFGAHDARTSEHRQQDLRRIYQQVGNITRRQSDAAVRRDLIHLLQERRKQQKKLNRFDAVADSQGAEVLLVPSELLMRAALVKQDTIKQLLDAYDLTPQPIECLKGRVVRLTAPGADGARIAEIAAALRARGVPVSPNHVTPMGIVLKGLGGPERSEGPAPAYESADAEGSPIRVAIIDTGITKQQRSDGWLAGLVRQDGDDDNVDPLDALPEPNDYLDLGAGHGTFAAGIVQQVAPGADLAVYKALDSDGIGSEVDVACAMVRAVDEGAQILNLSLGMETLDDQPPVVFEVALELIDEMAAKTGRELLVVAAAGNFGHARPCWPAALRRVIAVGGLTQDLAPAAWSTRGTWVDCSSIAEGVRSTYVKGQEHPQVDPQPDKFGEDAWALWTGTSFAAPQVAGALAHIAQQQGVGPRAALGLLFDRQPELPDYGRALRILPPTWRPVT